MREINTFDELYNTSIAIIENSNNTFADYSVIEIINYIRNNSDKELLNNFYILGNIPNYVADEILSKNDSYKILC